MWGRTWERRPLPGISPASERPEQTKQLRSGLGGEELGLLGVGAVAADHDQVDAVAAGRRRHAVERPGDVGSHWLAHT
jgi:hypothetical protein